MGILRKIFNKKNNNDSKEEINIEVGDPFKCAIDYNKTIEELLKYYDEQSKLISDGNKELANIELMMLGYGLDFIDFAQNVLEVKLTFDIECLEAFEDVLEAVHEIYLEKSIGKDEINSILKQATGYFGIIIIKQFNGNWVSTNIGMAVNINGTNSFINNRIARRIQNGSEDSMISFYNGLEEFLSKEN